MHKVLIYTTPTCGFCKMAKAFFKEHNVAYEEKDVSADQAAGEEMVKRSGQMGVPVIDIDGELVLGFDKAKLSALLGV
ncbi:MAG: glutathione S-transferase N-terminal domain-containing protein [Candidatus Magasanikbacteria bacterium]|nr:glutathione S-transferase N-terminal domain-containing protein [Candidatus Magasanikbacteria bacterium]